MDEKKIRNYLAFPIQAILNYYFKYKNSHKLRKY